MSHGAQKVRKKKVIQEKMKGYDSKRKKKQTKTMKTRGRKAQCRQGRKGQENNKQEEKDKQRDRRVPREAEQVECRGREGWRSREEGVGREGRRKE